MIHGDAKPWEIVLHAGRLRQALAMKAPQRFGYINGEVADVATDHPEYMAACVGVALARPDHGFGVPTSDPGAVVEWARWLLSEKRTAAFGTFDATLEAIHVCCSSAFRMFRWKKSPFSGPPPFPPPNWLWLISISTQQEADERLPFGGELGRMGWRWGVHAEPMLEPLAIIPDAYGTSLTDMPSWIVSGPPKGHRVSEAEVDWHRELRGQAWAAGIPYWYKGEALPDRDLGVET